MWHADCITVAVIRGGRGRQHWLRLWLEGGGRRCRSSGKCGSGGATGENTHGATRATPSTPKFLVRPARPPPAAEGRVRARLGNSGPMTSIRRFTCNDLFTFNAVNLDYFTETVRSSSLAPQRWLFLAGAKHTHDSDLHGCSEFWLTVTSGSSADDVCFSCSITCPSTCNTWHGGQNIV